MADTFPRQTNISVSLAQTEIPIFDLPPSRPITELNTDRVSLNNTGLYAQRADPCCLQVSFRIFKFYKFWIF